MSFHSMRTLSNDHIKLLQLQSVKRYIITASNQLSHIYNVDINQIDMYTVQPHYKADFHITR